MSAPEIAHPLTRTITVRHGILLKNDEQASRNRERFGAMNLFTVNVLASPGAGKTSLLERTLADLHSRRPCAVIVGDLATDRDACRLARPGVPVRQITTGNVCHLDAGMIEKACAEMDLARSRILFIENVGNLVCPASYDLGEHLRVVLHSVTEGEDKPLKYPKIFKTADVVVITKMDLAEAAGFDAEAARRHIRDVAPQAELLELSARTGQGLDAWYDLLFSRSDRVAA